MTLQRSLPCCVFQVIVVLGCGEMQAWTALLAYLGYCTAVFVHHFGFFTQRCCSSILVVRSKNRHSVVCVDIAYCLWLTLEYGLVPRRAGELSQTKPRFLQSGILRRRVLEQLQYYAR